MSCCILPLLQQLIPKYCGVCGAVYLFRIYRIETQGTLLALQGQGWERQQVCKSKSLAMLLKIGYLVSLSTNI